MTAVENSRFKEIGQMWATATQAELAEEARGFRNDHDDGSAHYFSPKTGHWEYCAEFPVALLFSSHIFEDAEKAKEWIEQDIADFIEDDEPGRAENYRDLLKQDICEPVIVSEVGGVYKLWDGWHRTAASMAKGAKTMRVIIGRRTATTPEPGAPNHVSVKVIQPALREDLYPLGSTYSR